jgi:hypothetical protein
VTALPALVLALGCRPPVALSEVPIVGAGPVARAEIVAELAAFEAAIGPARLALRRVDVVDRIRRDDDIAGGYRADRVWLTRDDPELASTLRHELCHAVHEQEGLLDDADPLWDTVAAGLYTADAGYAQAIRGHYPTARRQRHEAMAAYCELGPMALAALADPCPGEAPLAAELSAWLLAEVYSAYEVAEPVPAGPTVTLDGWLPGRLDAVVGTDAPGVLAVTTTDGGWSTWDAQSGAPVDVDAALHPTADRPPPVRGLRSPEAVGWRGGPAAARGSSSLFHLGASAPRLFVAGPPAETCPDGCWAVVEGSCGGPEDEQLFTADGGVLRAWTEGLAVKWSRL